jgi:hypothetical protein
MHGSVSVWISLGLMLIASVGVFVYLVRRETNRRRSSVLCDWASGQGWRRVEASAGLPDELLVLDAVGAASLGGFASRDGRWTVLQIASGGVRVSERSGNDAGSMSVRLGDEAVAREAVSRVVWHVMMLRTESPGATTALRSTAVERSIVDLMPLVPMPGQGAGVRFIGLGTSIPHIRFMIDRYAALIPADLSVMRGERFWIIDFSLRPFDEVEMGRLMRLLDQLASTV